MIEKTSDFGIFLHLFFFPCFHPIWKMFVRSYQKINEVSDNKVQLRPPPEVPGLEATNPFACDVALKWNSEQIVEKEMKTLEGPTSTFNLKRFSPFPE